MKCASSLTLRPDMAWLLERRGNKIVPSAPVGRPRIRSRSPGKICGVLPIHALLGAKAEGY